MQRSAATETAHADTDDEAADVTRVTDDPKNYELFDDLALGVMQRNAAVLETEQATGNDEKSKMSSFVFRCDVTTSEKREQVASVCTVDLESVLSHVAAQKTRSNALPSQFCYIESIEVEDATNTLPVDVYVNCRQNDKSLGHYVKGKTPGEESHHRAEPSLFVVHSGAVIHSDGGRLVHEANDFVDSSHFKTYMDALDTDIESAATILNGGSAVEYMSPTTEMTGDNVTKGDWLVNVMYQNPLSFKHWVQALRTPIPRTTESSAEDQYKFSLRMHSEDWENLNKAVQASVIRPLRESVIDLRTAKQLTFSLEPAVAAPPGPTASEMMNRSGTQLWNVQQLKGHEGRASVALKISMRFV